MSLHHNETSSLSPEKQTQITALTTQYRAALEEWAADPNHRRNLAVPEMVQNFLIPPKILELADDPTNVRATAGGWVSGKSLALAIVEKKPYVVNDLKLLKRLSEENIRDEDLPNGIVPLQVSNVSQLEDGNIGLDEFIFIAFDLEKFGDDELYVSYLVDREEFRGQKVATTFYERLREFAKALGFKYITGEGRQDTPERRGNLSFYIDKQGRIPYADLSPQLQRHFRENHGAGIEKDTFTVDFLDPEEAAPFKK